MQKICGLKLQKMLMDMHVLTVHNEMKTFVFSKCGKEFQNTTQRNRHMKRCKGAYMKPTSIRKPNPWHFCAATFTIFVERQSHLTTAHLTCSVRKAILPAMWVLKQQVLSDHKNHEPYSCPKCICGKEFASLQGML